MSGVYCGEQRKRRFETRHAARTAARLTPSPHCSVYRCPECKDYHVTHYPERVQRAISLLTAGLRKRRNKA